MLHLRDKRRECSIPFGGGDLLITEDGVITKEGVPLEYDQYNGKRFVTLDWIDGRKKYDVALIMLHSFRRTWLPLNMWLALDYHQLTSEYHIDAFIWLFPEGGLRCGPGNSYRYIPGFTRYAINDAGAVINMTTGEAMKCYTGRDGYINLSLVADTGDTRIVGRHRLQLLADGAYPRNVAKLDANHENSVPGDDRLDNLSWMTRAENVKHGIAHRKVVGQKHESVQGPIDILNTETGQECRELSIPVAAAQMGISGNCLTRYLRNKRQVKVNGIWVYKLSSDTEYNTSADQGHLKAVSVKFLETGEVCHYPRVIDAANALNISRDAVSWRLQYANQPIWAGNVLLKYRDDKTPWRLNSLDEVDEQVVVGTSKVVLVKNVYTRDVKEYPTLTDASSTLGVSMTVLSEAANDKTQPCVNTPNGIYVIKYKYDGCDFRELSDFPIELLNSGIAKSWIVIEDTLSNTKTSYLTSKIAAQVLELSTSTFCHYLSKDKKLINSRYYIRKWSPQDPFPLEFKHGSH